MSHTEWHHAWQNLNKNKVGHQRITCFPVVRWSKILALFKNKMIVSLLHKSHGNIYVYAKRWTPKLLLHNMQYASGCA